MRKRLLMLFLLFVGFLCGAHAQMKALVIKKSDGTTLTVALSERPQLFFRGSAIVLKTATEEVELSTSMEFDMNFSPTVDGIEHLITEKKLDLSADYVVLSGEQANAPITVYDTGGHPIVQERTDGYGCAVIPLSSMPKGIYIIKTTTTTHKITKK